MSSGKLDQALRYLAEAGELTYISLATSAGKGKHGVIFNAVYSPASAFGNGIGSDEDPVNAILKAIADKPIKKLRRAARLVVIAPGEKDATLVEDPLFL